MPPKKKIEGPRNAWRAAWESIEEAHRLIFNKHAPEGSLPDAVIAICDKKQKLCLKEAWTISGSQGKVIAYDLLEKIIKRLSIVKEIGHKRNPYSQTLHPLKGVFLFLDKLSSDTAATSAGGLEGVKIVCKLITRSSLLENIFDIHRSSTHHNTFNDLVKLYRTILEYLQFECHTILDPVAKGNTESVEQTRKSGIEALEAGEKFLLDLFEHPTLERTNISSAQSHRLYALSDQLDQPIVRVSRHWIDASKSLRAVDGHTILSWLGTTDPADVYERYISRPTVDTSVWLFKDQKFREWRELSVSQIFWLHALPGQGKSVLTANLIKHLTQTVRDVDQAAPVAYYFCVFSDSKRNTSKVILRSLLQQLCSFGSKIRIPEAVVRAYDRRVTETPEGSPLSSISTRECCQAIAEIARYSPFTFIIDGLDECTDTTQKIELLDILNELVKSSTNLIKIFVTSRLEYDIVQIFKNNVNVLEQEVEVAEAGDNIRVYARQRLGETGLAKKSSPQEIEHITEQLVKQSGGMFLWVKLMVEQLSSLHTKADIVRSLQEFPSSIVGFYDSSMDNILANNESDRNLAFGVLRWVFSARNPPTAPILIAALATESDPGVVDRARIQFVCQQMITYDANTDSFRFLHYSAKEYLSTRKGFTDGEANSFVARCCLQNLLRSGFAIVSDISEKSLQAYANQYWPVHYRKAVEAPDFSACHGLASKFLRDGKLTQRWFKSILTKANEMPAQDQFAQQMRSCVSSDGHPVFAAAAFNLMTILKDAELVTISSLDKRNDQLQSPLLIAIENGYQDLAVWIVENMEPVAVSSVLFDSQLLPWLATSAYLGVMKALQSRGAISSDRCDENDRTQVLLHAAVLNDNVSMVQSVLKSSIDKSANGMLDDVLVKVAASHGHFHMLRIILEETDAHADRWDDLRGTPLQLAAGIGALDIARYLLDLGANANKIPGPQGVALTIASKAGHGEVVNHLLEVGADVSHMDASGRSALSYAAEGGFFATAECLLTACSDEEESTIINSTDNLGQSALHYAAIQGSRKIVQMLLNHNASFTIKNNEGKSARALATTKAVRQLLTWKERVALDIAENFKPLNAEIDNCFDASVVNFEVKNKHVSYTRRTMPLTKVLSAARLAGNLVEQESGHFTWIHIPANNMTWVEAVMSHYFSGREQTDRDLVLNNDLWVRRQHQGGGKHYAQFMRPACEKIPTETHKDGHMVLFMPYLHWERVRWAKQLAKIVYSQRPPTMLGTIKDGSQDPEEWLLRQYLSEKHPLHVRRTLDQSYYYRLPLPEIRKRDRTQIVQKWLKENHSGSEPDEHVLIMVDQLWLWKLDQGTIITSFPQRWGARNEFPDPDEFDFTNVLDSISLRCSDIDSTDRLMNLIVEECSSICLNATHAPDTRLHFLDMFEDSIGKAMNMKSNFLDRFKRQQRKGVPGHIEPYPSHPEDDPARSYNIKPEMEKLSDIYDIRDELYMMISIFKQQAEVVQDAHRLGTQHQPNSPGGMLTGLEGSKDMPDPAASIEQSLSKLQDLDDLAARVESSLKHLLEIKQLNANVAEARSANEFSEEARRQGNTLMVFTITTIIFLPLSFISAFFTIDVSEFARDTSGRLPLAYVCEYLFPITIACVVPLLALAFGFNYVERFFMSIAKQFRKRVEQKRKARQGSVQEADKLGDEERPARNWLLRKRRPNMADHETKSA